MEGHVNRGVQGSQLKSVKKEHSKLKNIAVDEQAPPKARRKSPVLSFPGVVQIQCAGQTATFMAQLSGTTVPLMQKPLNVFRQKVKRQSVAQ